MLHTGLHWVRYWVRFDTGAERGSIHRDKLVREEEWEDFLAGRAAAEAAAEAGEPAELPGGDAPELPASDAGGDAGGDVVVNGGYRAGPFAVPQCFGPGGVWAGSEH